MNNTEGSPAIEWKVKDCKPYKSQFFECSCGDSEHVVKLSYDFDEKEYCFSFFLCQYRGFFKRVWTAIKYIFGYKCRYGHWDVVTLSAEDAKRMKGFLDE